MGIVKRSLLLQHLGVEFVSPRGGLTKQATLAVLDAEVADGPISKGAHRHAFEYEPQQGFLYVRSRAISSRTNDNFDTFPADEIAQAWMTFVGKPVYVNHHNDDPERARGVIIDAALHEDIMPDGTPDTWVEVLMEIDAINFPRLAEAIINGDIERTSMGCDVQWSECSVCGNKATTPSTYCPHVARMKGQRIRRRSASTGLPEDVLVHEVCHGLSFFENSVLVEPPADPTAHFLGVDMRGVTAMAKAASVTAKDGRDHGNTDKGNTTERGYGWDHQKKREELLKNNPKCHWGCGRKATEADHTTGGKLVPSCSECNNERSHDQQKRKGALGKEAAMQFTMVNRGGAFELHVAGCGDLMHPKYTLSDRDGISADSAAEAVTMWVDDLRDQGYTESDVKVFPCAKSGTPAPTREVDPSSCPATGKAIDNPRRMLYLFCSECGKRLGTGRGVWPKHKPIERSSSKDPRFEGVSVKQDDDGWYVSTHRARSDSYASAEEIPNDVVQFIESTGAAMKTTAVTDTEADTIIARFPESVRSRAEALRHRLVYGPSYDRNVTENLIDASRFFQSTYPGTINNGEYALRKAEAKEVFLNGGEFLPAMHPDSEGQQQRMFSARKEAASAQWTQTAEQYQTYQGLAETLPTHSTEFEGGEAGIVGSGTSGNWIWSAVARDGEEAEGSNTSLDAAKSEAESFLRDHNQIAGQMEMSMAARRTANQRQYEMGFADGRRDFQDDKAPAHVDGDEFVERDYDRGYAAGYAAAAHRNEMGWERKPFDPSIDWGTMHMPAAASTKVAFGETTVPPKIDTLSIPECPVCRETESRDGDGRCRTCGYLPAPEPFREPDLEVAQRADVEDGEWFNPDLMTAPPFEPESADDPGTVEDDPSDTKNRRDKESDMNAATAARISIRQQAAGRTTADIENPAQPVPEPAETAPSETSEQAVTPNVGTVDTTTPGGVAEAPAPDTTADVTSPGGVMPAPAPADVTSVTAPVSGGTDIPEADLITEKEVVTSGETLGEPAFGTDNSWVQAQATVRRIAATVTDRNFAALRLARLRIASRIAAGDDLALGQAISQSNISTEAIRTEIKTLEAVASANAQAPRGGQGGGRIVPTATRTTPSLTPPAGRPLVGMGVGGADDEFAFLS